MTYEITGDRKYRIYYNRIYRGGFPECQILLLGETEQKSNRNKSLSVYPMPKTEEEFKDIFKTYEFEGVIYFSNYLTFHGTMEGEIETLHKLLHYYKGI